MPDSHMLEAFLELCFTASLTLKRSITLVFVRTECIDCSNSSRSAQPQGLFMFIGLLLALLSGFCYGICFLPMRYMNKFAWENTWFVYSPFGVLILPVLTGWLAMPFLFDLYRQVGWRTNSIMLALGFISGAVAVLYGLALIRIGVALVNAIGNGISIVLGSSIPLLIQHREALQDRLGFALVSGVILGSLSCLTAFPLPSCPSRRSSTPGSTARAPMERSSTPRSASSCLKCSRATRQ
jgi:hypothetical protein